MEISLGDARKAISEVYTAETMQDYIFALTRNHLEEVSKELQQSYYKLRKLARLK